MSAKRKPMRGPQPTVRRQGARNPKARFVVVTEGEVTEPEYLKQLEAEVGALVTIRPVAPNLDPRGLAQEAVASLVSARKVGAIQQNDQFWCFLDVDDYGMAEIEQATELAARAGVRVAVSNPCFEVWLLAHFRYSTGERTSHELATELGAFVAGYGPRSKHLPRGALDGLRPTARTNARRLDTHHSTAGNAAGSNPSTGVWEMVDEVFRLSAA